MKFETENPTLVKLMGIGLAVVAVTIGATLAPGAMPWLTGVAGLALGTVGIQIGGKS